MAAVGLELKVTHLAKSLRRRLRNRRQLRRIRHRQVVAIAFGKYELVGGPNDGETVDWVGGMSFHARGGIYRPGLDWRLHFYAPLRARQT